MSPRGLILMTALPPTAGHLALCEFAATYMQEIVGGLTILMCSLDREPPGRSIHSAALQRTLMDRGYTQSMVRVVHRITSNDPQSPSGPDDDEFWAHWTRVAMGSGYHDPVTHLFSSEKYGDRLAPLLGAKHVVFDPGRDIVPVKATKVRMDVAANFRDLVPPLRDAYRRRVVLFGQESTGKTTLARRLAAELDSVWCPEWARGYLESLPSPEVTHDRMDEIVLGQYAAEEAAHQRARSLGCPFLFLDTDLLSTMGYLEIYRERQKSKFRTDETMMRALRLWRRPGDLYIVCPDSVPMEPDPLRYGGDVRESTRDFWIRLLEEKGLEYYCIPRGLDADAVLEDAKRICLTVLRERVGFSEYVRSE